MKRTLMFFIICLIVISVDAQISKKIDVGGHKIDTRIKQGGPIPVVFEAGLTKDLTCWDPVFNVVGSFTTAVAYSRAGSGDSEAGTFPRTPSRIFKDFNVLIDSLGLNQPIILVGHSWGGLLARYYTTQIPERIGGLVLVDGTHGAENQTLIETDSIKWGYYFKGYSAAIDSLKRAKAFSESVFSEWDAIDDICESGGKGFEPLALPNIPIVVITAQGGDSSDPDIQYTKRKNQAEWLQYSTNAMWIITEKSGHDIMVFQPNLIIDGIEYINNILLAEHICGN